MVDALRAVNRAMHAAPRKERIEDKEGRKGATRRGEPHPDRRLTPSTEKGSKKGGSVREQASGGGMGWSIAGTLIRYMKGRAREQVLVTRAARAWATVRVKGALREREARKGDTGRRTGRGGRKERAGRVHDHRTGTKADRVRWKRACGRWHGGRKESDGEGTERAAHESSTQQTQEQHEEVMQGGGEEHQSTRTSTAGAAAEQEDSGDRTG